jgi:tight adherence protein B
VLPSPRAASKFLDIRAFVDQSGVNIEPSKLLMMMGGIGLAAGVAWLVFAPYKALMPIITLVFAIMPMAWIWWKRRRRLSKFSSQLPEALELISRALRAGHSLPAGIHLCANQVDAPLGEEFSRCFEEQNLGIPLEEAFEEMTRRVPNVDLRFFVTAVVLQRTTGGDLAEILDKISRLIRERFQIHGQIQALTGEGRLSGIVLLALPPALFLVMMRLNYDYVMMLFNEPLGQKMLAGAIVMQVIGAIVIKKIITIKV